MHSRQIVSSALRLYYIVYIPGRTTPPPRPYLPNLLTCLATAVVDGQGTYLRASRTRTSGPCTANIVDTTYRQTLYSTGSIYTPRDTRDRSTILKSCTYVNTGIYVFWGYNLCNYCIPAFVLFRTYVIGMWQYVGKCYRRPLIP